MRPYLINTINTNGYGILITLLDYQTPISRCLKSITISPNIKGKILIDTVLCSGMNEYRFIETKLNEDGSINLDQYKYVTVDDELVKICNRIVKTQPLYLNNYVLTKSNKETILQS